MCSQSDHPPYEERVAALAEATGVPASVIRHLAPEPTDLSAGEFWDDDLLSMGEIAELEQLGMDADNAFAASPMVLRAQERPEHHAVIPAEEAFMY